MPICDPTCVKDQRKILSKQLVSEINNSITKFCFEKKISRNEIPEILDASTLSLLAQDLGLEVNITPSDSIPFGIELIRNFPYFQK